MKSIKTLLNKTRNTYYEILLSKYAYTKYLVRFQVLTTARMKMIAFWDIAPCSLVISDDGGSTHL
jgi:hypothetical protein